MSGSITRIKNNQITTASGNISDGTGINAAAKLQNYTVTSTKLANSLVYGSDLTISGNLTVNGTTTAIDTVNTLIEDPIVTLADGQTAGTPTVDIGILGLRGNQLSSFLGWNEANTEFAAVLSNTTASNTTVSINSYANFHANNITAGGNLSVAGNITGNVSFTGNITAGNLLTTGVMSAAGNVTGGNITTAGAVTATGNVTGGNITTAGAVTATGNIQGGNLLTAGLISATSTITSATTITGGNLATAGTVSATGNVTGGNLLTAGLISATSTITSAANITGGNLLTGGVVSATGTATVGNLATAGTVSATGNVTGGNVTTAGAVTATGNVTGGNVLTSGIVSAAGNIIANPSSFFIGNGSQLTGVAASSANFPVSNGTSNINAALNANITVGVSGTSNVAVFAPTGVYVTGEVSANGNVTGGNITTAGAVTATGNITGGNILTPGLISAAGLATSGNVQTAGYVSATGNVFGGNVVTGNLASSAGLTISTTSGNANINIQPNGSGNIVLGGNTYINGVSLQPQQDNDVASKYYVDQVATTGFTIHPAVFAATTSNLATATGGTITYNQPNGAGNGIGATITTTGSFTTIDTANVQTVGTRILVKNEGNAALNGVYVYSNSTVITRSTDTDEYGADSANAFSINDYFFVQSGNVNKGAAYVVDAPAGTITFGTSNIQFAQFSSSQVYSANTAAGLVLNGTEFSAKVDNNTTAFDGGGNIIVKAGANLTTPNIGAATGTSLSTTGNITTSGNLVTTGYVTATGNVTGGNVNTAGTVSATGNVTGGNITTAGAVTATGNITGGNLITSGVLTATGTATVGNLATGGTVSATGNVTGGNITTAGAVTATGNVTGGNLITSGVLTATGTATVGNLATAGTVSATGNVTGGNILFGSGIVSGTGNIYAQNIFANIAGNIDAAGNINEVQFNGTGDILAASAGFTFNPTGNVLTANGNINGANLFTGGTVSATGNLISGNVTTAGLITATGNITGGNVTTAGLVTATGNITGGNISTAGLITATGNILGGNLILAGAAIDTTAGRLTVNSTLADADFAVNGLAANVFYVDAGANTASFGASTQVANAIVNFATTNSIKIPVGNTAQRPGGSPTTGMLRFNTSLNAVEIYDNAQWTPVGQVVFTVIADEQFNGDGSTVAFTLSSTQTTNSCIVSINGVVQIPTLAYSVSGTNPTCVLTFTEAPAPGDVIDVRQITTTTTVTSLQNVSGNAKIQCLDTSATTLVTGDLSVTGNVNISGNVATNQINNGTSAVQIPVASGNVNIDVGATDNMTVFTPTLMLVTGNISATGDVTAQNVNSLSDATLKTNIQPISGIESVLFGLNGVEYDWKNGQGHSYGFLAQEVEQVLPSAVKTGADGLKSVNYQMIIPFLVETIKQMGAEITDLKKTVSSRSKKK